MTHSQSSSFLEDANWDHNSHSNTQDDSIDRFLNDTITINDDPTVDNSQEEQGHFKASDEFIASMKVLQIPNNNASETLVVDMDTKDDLKTTETRFSEKSGVRLFVV